MLEIEMDQMKGYSGDNTVVMIYNIEIDIITGNNKARRLKTNESIIQKQRSSRNNVIRIISCNDINSIDLIPIYIYI